MYDYTIKTGKLEIPRTLTAGSSGPVRPLPEQARPRGRDLVILDLDNVIVRGQSQLLLLKYIFRRRYVGIRPLARIFGWYCLYRLGLLRNPRGIGDYAFSFLRGWEVRRVAEIFHDFFENVLKAEIRPEMRAVVETHREAGRELVIVSSACDLVVESIAAFLGISRFISTSLEKEGGVYTGRVSGAMVYGREKLNRAAPLLQNCARSWAYADHVSDLPLLTAVDRPTAVNPCPRMAAEARRRGWPVLVFPPPGPR